MVSCGQVKPASGSPRLRGAASLPKTSNVVVVVVVMLVGGRGVA
jgi:hypothetical protein